jgi:hypothetical protein
MHVVSTTMMRAVVVSLATFVVAHTPAADAETVQCPRGDGLLHNGRVAQDPAGTRVRDLRAVNVPPERLTQGGGAPPQRPCDAAGQIAEQIVYYLDIESDGEALIAEVGLDPDGEPWIIHYRGLNGPVRTATRIGVTARHRRQKVTMTLWL